VSSRTGRGDRGLCRGAAERAVPLIRGTQIAVRETDRQTEYRVSKTHRERDELDEPLPGLFAEASRKTPEFLRDRVIAKFLHTISGSAREHSFGRVAVALYWACLRGYVESRRWKIAAHLGFTVGGEGLQQPRSASLDGRVGDRLEVPENEAMFIEAGEQRLVVESIRAGYMRDHGVRISTDGSSEAFLDGWTAYVREHHPFRGRAFLSSGELVEIPAGLDWESVFIPEEVKSQIRFHVGFLLDHSAALRADLGVRSRRGLILSGPPGTGKTLIGRILSATLRTTMLWVTPGAFERGADEVQGVLALARLVAPCILFLEDIDTTAEERLYNPQQSRLGELMNQLDGAWGDHPIIAIATSNRADALEGAVRNRPGRFDRIIEIPAPTAENRRAYFAKRFARQRISDGDLDWLVSRTDAVTGAELEECANTILMRALETSEYGADAPLNLVRESIRDALVEQGLQAELQERIGFGSRGTDGCR